EQSAETQRRWAERVPAGAHVDALLATDTPNADLPDEIRNDASLTPLRRLVAMEMLDERLWAFDAEADRVFAALTKDATDGDAVRAAAVDADLSPRARAMLLERLDGWEPG
ncbi:MAG: hypothetical protein AAGK04_07890, partial [Planctomycetota bacterium]